MHDDGEREFRIARAALDDLDAEVAGDPAALGTLGQSGENPCDVRSRVHEFSSASAREF
jgi:hypothetical protein